MNEEDKYELCQSLSKSGSLIGYTDKSDVLKEFAKTGTDAQIIEFYVYLRENSERSEDEWREEFESFFPKVLEQLPSASDESQWGDILHRLVETGDLAGLKTFIEEIGILTWPLDEDWEEYDLYPIEAEDEDCQRPIEKAQRLGHHELAEYLISVLSRFKSVG